MSAMGEKIQMTCMMIMGTTPQEISSTDKEKICELPDGNIITVGANFPRCAAVFSGQVSLANKPAVSTTTFCRTS